VYRCRRRILLKEIKTLSFSQVEIYVKQTLRNIFIMLGKNTTTQVVHFEYKKLSEQVNRDLSYTVLVEPFTVHL
jgi:hypothetical protein